MKIESFETLLRHSLEKLNDLALHDDYWKIMKDDKKNRIQFFKPKNSSDQVLTSKSVMHISASSKVILKTFTDYDRAKEFDSYFDQTRIVKRLLTDGETFELMMHDGTDKVVITRCDINHTKYQGVWPVFSPRDAVHLLVSGTFTILDSSGVPVEVTFLCLVSLDDELAKQLVPVSKSHTRMCLKIGGGICIPDKDGEMKLIQVNSTDLRGWMPKKIVDIVSSYDSQLLFKKACESRKKEYEMSNSVNVM
jgi:hypothetical protein